MAGAGIAALSRPIGGAGQLPVGAIDHHAKAQQPNTAVVFESFSLMTAARMPAASQLKLKQSIPGGIITLGKKYVLLVLHINRGNAAAIQGIRIISAASANKTLGNINHHIIFGLDSARKTVATGGNEEPAPEAPESAVI